MKIDRAFIKDYQKQLEIDLNRIRGLNDINLLLEEFEEVFSQYIGTKYSVSVNSGTDALQLSLLALGVGKGHSVIMPDVAYPAVPLSVIYAGAEPIFIDIKEKNLQIDEDLIRENIKNNTKAIIAVHMFSLPCNIETVLNIAREYNLYVIEDCCQAESSEYREKKVGTFGDLSCFSFSYYKPLSSCGGGGGMVCFNDKSYKGIIDYTKIWNDDGILVEVGKRFARMYFFDLIAVKTKFKFLDSIIKSRRIIKAIYDRELGRIKGVKTLQYPEYVVPVLQNYTIFSDNRDELDSYLRKNNIFSQRPYAPFHTMNIFKPFITDKFPVSEIYLKKALHLPLYSFMDTKDCYKVIECIRKYVEN